MFSFLPENSFGPLHPYKNAREAKLQRLTRSIGPFRRMSIVTSSLKKVCQNSGHRSFSPRGLPGPPGEMDPKVIKATKGGRVEKDHKG